MRKLQPIFIVLLSTLVLSGGAVGQDAPARKTFRFPGGNSEDGREAFIALNCVQCHTVANVLTDKPKGKKRLNLQLGDTKRFVKNYEDLIISITNPKHVIQEQYRAILNNAELAGGIEPLMPNLTKDMSAQQLMDLVVFLDKVYSDSLDGYGK